MKIETKMVETIMDNQSYYLEDFLRVKDAVSNSKAIYKGQPVPYLYIPKIYDKKDVETFKSALSGMMDVVERTIGLYKTEASVRRLFGFDNRLEELILLPHDYDVTVPMGRFDIFYYGPGEYKFCELNADGASAMNEEKELSAIMRENAIVGAFESKYDFQVFELFHTWVNALGDIYSSYTQNRGIEPKPKSDTVVAIVDFIDKSSSIEFEVFKEAFIEQGYQCIIVDPRNIKTMDGKMIADGLVIDVIYRRLVTKDLMDRYDEIPDFIQGLKACETCVVGSVKTQIIHTKRFFEVDELIEFDSIFERQLLCDRFDEPSDDHCFGFSLTDAPAHQIKNGFIADSSDFGFMSYIHEIPLYVNDGHSIRFGTVVQHQGFAIDHGFDILRTFRDLEKASVERMSSVF